MLHAVDPQQTSLFDPAETMFSPMALKWMRRGWPHVFRTWILKLMPVREVAKHFNARIGCPTKELFAMAGVIFLKEVFNLTIEATVEHFLTNASWQYALNVNPMQASLCTATVERYMRLFVEDDLAAEVFNRVTTELVEALELDVSRQRLDSTHIFSDMATFGRTKLMGVSIKRFLTQLKRHHRDLYEQLDEALRSRYAPSPGRLFADFKGGRRALRQAVAEDLLALVSRFADHEAVANRSTYKTMTRVLEEQCDVVEEHVELKAKPGGDVLQNPSDPDAGYDGHKGPGYQVQLAETCDEDNDVQLITGVFPEPADCQDADALEPMLEQLASQDRTPDTLYADTAYGSDANVTAAQARGVDLQSPVRGTPTRAPDALTIDDFVVDEASETVERCPNGCEPLSSKHDPATGVTTTHMDPAHCRECEFFSACPVKKAHSRFVLRHTAKQRRLAARRAEQATDAFSANYAIRSGGESVNSGLKRKMGMGRLRVRGSPRVRMAVLLRCAGWNLLRAVHALRKRGKGDFAALLARYGRGALALWASERPARPPVGLLATTTPRFPATLRPLAA